MKKLLLVLLLSVLLSLIVAGVLSVSTPVASLPLTSITPRTLHSGHHFLPPYPNPRDRFGFDSGPVTGFDVAQLNAGWYSNWGASLNPAHPDGLTYVQLIRFHAGSDPHDPSQVTVQPDRDTIAQIAALHPGSLWFMSNEPDSLYQGDPIYPDVYAHVYHEFYTYIKGLDSTALIANGGIVQPTPCRMEYLDIVWDTYQQAYSETMPVDVWNIHAFTLREVYGSWGASTPPGVDHSCAMNYAIRDGDDIDIFRNNLIAFRQWMKEKGEQNKPLIISEYGVLWPDWLKDEDGCGFPPARVSHFMTQTFDLFLNQVYMDVGYPEDDYRLVQAWAWYSLSDDQQYNGYLFHNNSKQISAMGQAYAAYTAALPDTQYSDLAAQLWVDLDPLRHTSYDAPSVTLPVTGAVVNLGNAPVTGVVITSPMLEFQTVQDFSARYEEEISTLLLPSLVLTRPGVYSLSLTADPGQEVADPRRWNNTLTITLDTRPDLQVLTTTWSVRPTEPLSGQLNITSTVANVVSWPAPPVSGTLYFSDATGGTLSLLRRFPIPSIGSNAHVTIVETLPLPSSSAVSHHLVLEVDGDDVVEERDEGNNRIEVEIDTRPDLLISTTTQSMQYPSSLVSKLNITITVANEAVLHTPPVSGVIYLSDTLLLPCQRFPIPSIASGTSAIITASFELPFSDDDFWHLKVQVDSDDVLAERDEENNWAEVNIPIVVTTTLQPNATSVLTSASRRLTFLFPAGIVTTATEIRFIPRMVSDLPPGPPLGVIAFGLAAYRKGQPVSLTLPFPITVTWRYTDTDVARLNDNTLELYRLMDGEHWQRVSCASQSHWPEVNLLQTCIPQLGEYIFGQGYKLYMPIIIVSVNESASEEQSPVPGAVIPGMPLRLPSAVCP